jgi:hypothetical protein
MAMVFTVILQLRGRLTTGFCSLLPLRLYFPIRLTFFRPEAWR